MKTHFGERASVIGFIIIPALLVLGFGIGAITWEMKFRQAEVERALLRRDVVDLQFQIKQARVVGPDDAPEFYKLQTGMDAKLDEILALLKK